MEVVGRVNGVDYRLAAATRELLPDARFVVIEQEAELDDVRALASELGVFDGLAAGRLIALNYGGWQVELLKKHGAGFVLSRGVERGATTLPEWLGDEARLVEAGLAVRRMAEGRFARDDHADRLERVLLEPAIRGKRS